MGVVGNISFNSLSLTAAVATAVCAAQAVAGAGSLTINGTLASGGVATIVELQRRIVAVSANAGDTTQTLTVTGTNYAGTVISEVITLNGTTPVGSQYDYKTVTKAVASAATAGNISVGTSTVGSTPWVVINHFIKPVQIGLFANLASGAASFSVEETMDDPNLITPVWAGQNASIEPGSYSPPVPFADASTGAITAKSASAAGVLNMPVFAYRLTILSGTGLVTLQGIQAGIHE